MKKKETVATVLIALLVSASATHYFLTASVVTEIATILLLITYTTWMLIMMWKSLYLKNYSSRTEYNVKALIGAALLFMFTKITIWR